MNLSENISERPDDGCSAPLSAIDVSDPASACEMATQEILSTSFGAIETGYVKLTSREDAASTTLVYAVSWRRENSSMKVVLNYFAPATM
jgi:hypothetical protein